MNISTATSNIRKHMIGYLNRSIPVNFSDKDLKQAWEKFQIADDPDGLDFIHEPLVELAASYKLSSESLAKLAENGDLEPEVAKAFAKYLLDNDDADASYIFPYEHQANALKDVAGGKNLVVCTGTGSGKTECFLLPVVNELFKQHRDKPVYCRHVRALILYPMNALVNDQIRRLRKLLKYLPDITFGRYTSETDHELDALENEEEFNRAWQDFSKVKVVPDFGRDETSLQNEYRYRSQWADGGADILVTNYAMLERLLLMPDSTMFGQPWDFIVLDEAHSYSGSTGTEIAWLIRRLKNRLDPAGQHPVRFLATSATLSTGNDAEEKARAFASTLFPAEESTFSVQLGNPADISPPPTAISADPDFFSDSKTRNLYAETVAYEAERADHDSRNDAIGILRDLEENDGWTSLRKISMLVNYFKSHAQVREDLDGHAAANEIEATDSVKWLCRLAFSFSENANDFQGILHDELDNENRLSLFDEWRRVKGADVPNGTIHWETIVYLYRAIETLVQPSLRIKDEKKDVSLIGIRVCDAKRKKLKEEIREFDNETQRLAGRKATLDEQWRILLAPTEPVGRGYREILYDALFPLRETKAFFNVVQGRSPLSTKDIAAMIWPNEPNGATARLAHLLELGALAVPQNMRRPLFDVRFHQTMRDIADIGVYYRKGNLSDPVFVRSIEEFSEMGEKIFSLGVCRRCGQPFLLGYANARINDGADGVVLYRNRTESHTFLHAFALKTDDDPKQVEDAEPENSNTELLIDLTTGRLLDEAPEEGCVQELRWLVVPEIDKAEFITKCPSCGNMSRRDARYGIVTPYEATGLQYRVRALEAFARETNPDSNERVRNSPEVSAEGRKALAFSDSRAAAAGLAYAFDKTIETDVCDDIVLKLCDHFEQIGNRPDPNQEEEIHQLENKIRDLEEDINYTPPDNVERIQRKRGEIDECMHEIEFIRRNAEMRQPTIQSLVFCGNDQNNTYAEIARDKHCERLLDFETPQGMVDDRELLAKYRVLKALLSGSSRIGLLPEGLVGISSKKLRSMEDDQMDPLFGNPFNEIDHGIMRKLLQQVFVYLVRSRDIKFDVNNNDWEEALHDDFFPFERKDFTRGTVTTPDKNHAVFKIVKNFLAGEGLVNFTNNQIGHLLTRIWDLFTNQELFAIGGGDTYHFLFSALCDDLIVEQTPSARDRATTMPFVIQEHTAQIKSAIGAVYQHAFSEGRINILSCSTTFEMGVDVGSLNNVFLGNVPPGPANYRQRAGRAGRRPGAAPFILMLCNGRSSHDLACWKNPGDLFSKPIAPPCLYLDKPQFAARHFRAEALHDFFQFLQQRHGDNEAVKGDKWQFISHFLLGRKSSQRNRQRTYTRLGNTCCDWLDEWREENATRVGESIKTIPGYGRILDNLPGGQYDATEDVIFQLTGKNGFGNHNGCEGFRFYRDLCGCHLPQLADDQSLQEHRNPRRKSLKDQMEAKLWFFKDEENNGDFPDNLDDRMIFGEGTISAAQAKLLQKQTISVLSEACILPRYGFPVDSIELKPDSDDWFANKVELSRPVQQGIFEYAPGQSVTANKRRYESRAAKSYLFRQGDANHVQAAAAAVYMHCRECEKVFAAVAGDSCPCCGNPLQRRAVVTPELFLARRSTTRRQNAFPPRGKRIVVWAGAGGTEVPVDGLNLSVMEPEERFVQYINPGPGFKGFGQERRGQWQGHFYLHEAPTNIAIWIPSISATKLEARNEWGKIPDGLQIRNNRTIDAYLSAMYALRRAISNELNIQETDVGCLLHQDRSGGQLNHWFVFFDSDTGGGSGCVLDLLLRDKDDATGINRIRNIVENARKQMDECNCGNEIELDRFPVSQADWLTNENRDDIRRHFSCQDCLRSYDNQFEHDRLDRFDAKAVLDSLLGEMANPPSDEEDDVWVDFDPTMDHLIPGQPYLTHEGKTVRFNPLTNNLKADDVAKKRQERQGE